MSSSTLNPNVFIAGEAQATLLQSHTIDPTAAVFFFFCFVGEELLPVSGVTIANESIMETISQPALVTFT